MRIGIITPYDSANFGAFLQAYASKMFLEKQGHQVFFVKWRSEKERKKEFFKHSSGIKAKLRFYQQYLFLRKRYNVMKNALHCFEELSELESTYDKLDCCILGSDEIWNIKVKQFQKSIFYGEINDKKIPCLAYAPSAGQATEKDFEKFIKTQVMLKKVNIIGVRDVNTVDVINKLIGNTVPLVCDPTCLVPIDDLSFPKANIKIHEYILVYSYSVPKEHRNYIKQYAKENHLKTVAVCMPQAWCDLNVNCNPLEFNSYIENAMCVYTTTFHGAIFTLLNHKACAIYPVSNKLCDLLKWTEKEDVIISNNTTYGEFSNLLSTTTEYLKFEENLKDFRKQSFDFYKRELNKLENHLCERGNVKR